MDPVLESRQPGRFVIVAGVDFSDASEYALAIANKLARSAGQRAEIHALHVVEPLHAPGPGAGLLPSVGHDPAEAIDAKREHLLFVIRKTCASLEAQARADDPVVPPVRVEPHVCLGDAATEIAAFAREKGADLIVLGAHRHGAVWRALHRSVSAHLVRRAPCSVFIAVPTGSPARETAHAP